MSGKLLVLKSFLKGFFITILFSTVYYFTISLTFGKIFFLFKDPKSWMVLPGIIIIMSATALVVGIVEDPEQEKKRRPLIRLDDIFVFMGTLCLTFAIPIMLLVWLLSPHGYKKALYIGVFFISTGIAITYYLFNKKKFPKIADKITFFSGVCLGPVFVAQILF